MYIFSHVMFKIPPAEPNAQSENWINNCCLHNKHNNIYILVAIDDLQIDFDGRALHFFFLFEFSFGGMRETIFWRIIIIKQILWSKKKHKIENEVEYAKLGSWESYTSSFVSISFFFLIWFFPLINYTLIFYSLSCFNARIITSTNILCFFHFNFVFIFWFCFWVIIILESKREKKIVHCNWNLLMWKIVFWRSLLIQENW